MGRGKTEKAGIRFFVFWLSPFTLHPSMRRRTARNLFWTLTLSAGVMSLVGPGLHGVQATAAVLFAPVSWPAYRASLWAARVAGGQSPLDAASPRRPRAASAVYAQNAVYRQRIVALETQLDALKKLNRDRQRLGETLLPRLAAARVTGGDGEVLNVLNSDFATFRPRMPVLQYDAGGTGVAGVISAVGVASAQVRLVSDPRFVAEGQFVRFAAGSEAPQLLAGPKPLVEGAGGGKCRVARYREADLAEAGVRAGDWVVLADDKWPPELAGFRIGRVADVTPLADEPGFARVGVEPGVDLSALREVMVLVR